MIIKKFEKETESFQPILINSKKWYTFYGATYVYEFPTGSANKLNLKEIANELRKG